MKNFIQKGDAITVVAESAVASGNGVKVGNLFGIAAGNAAVGEPLTLSTVGVFELPKVAADAMEIGEVIYWDDTAKLVTLNATDNFKIGVAVTAAGNPSGEVAVRLNGAF